MSAIMEMSIFPMDKGVSLSPYVARAVDIIRKSGLDHEFGPMGTCVEGDMSDLMALAGQCFKDMKKDCDRIYLNIKFDYLHGGSGRLKGKVESVRDKLEKS